MTRKVAPAVDLRSTDEGAEIRRRLVHTLSRDVSFNSDDEPSAIVVIGESTPLSAVAPNGVPVSTVSLGVPRGPNVRIVAADSPAPVPVGWSAVFHATIEATDLAGTTSHIVLTQRGAELVRRDHTWTRDREQIDVAVPYIPPVAGTSRMSLTVLPAEREVTDVDNTVDVRVTATARRLRVLIVEARPSWGAAFVRRVLEQDATFDVSALVRASRGLEVRGGEPPASVSADALTPFDVVLVGAPEGLEAAEVESLRVFMRRRGGTVVLLPDRRPSGAYLKLLPVTRFDEELVDGAVALRPTTEASSPGSSLRASEFALPRDGLSGADIRAFLDRGQEARAVVVEWPLGAGRVVFSGALDGWRYRAAPGAAFARFWKSLIAEGAMAAPSRVELSVSPGVARAGEEVTIRARLRRTELDEASGRIRVPPVSARLVGSGGIDDIIRLWPDVETGAFVARIEAPEAGDYDVQVSSGGATADDILRVAADVRHPAGAHDSGEVLKLLATATGGVAVGASDLAPLEQYLRSLPQRDVARVVHPTRSVWFVIVFASVLAGEWAIRRRRGHA
jgi:hypothetical protein